MPGPGVPGPSGVWSKGGLVLGGLVPVGCLVETSPGTATVVGGTHPTGMHSFT